MNTLSKVGIAFGTLGGVSGAGYVIKQQLTTNGTIADIGVKLIKEGYQLLNDANAPEWTEILNSYKATIVSNPELKFEDFNGSSSTNELPRLCGEATKVNLSENKDQNLFERARRWCTKPRTLEDILAKKGYKLLSFDLSKDEEIDKWDEILDKYNASTENNKKFDGVSLLSTDNALKKDQATRNKLREKCNPLKDKKHHTKDFAKELEQVELWCSVSVPK